MRRNKTDLVRAWLDKATKDQHFAELALDQGPEYADITCFHAQQAAEKSLKAYLVWLELDFPKTHVLDDLLDLIDDNAFETHRDSLSMLTPFAVESRYPEISIPSAETAAQAVDSAKAVLELVRDLLPDKCLPQS